MNTGLLLYMQRKNKPVINFMDDNLFNSFLFCEGEKLYLNTAVSPNFIPIAEEILQKSYKIVYYELNPICPICGQPLNKNGLQKFILNKNKIIYKQKYSCKCCKYYKTTSLETFIGKYCNYTLEIKELSLNFSTISYSSYENKANYINLIYDVKICRQTSYISQSALIDQYLDAEEKKVSELIKGLNIKPSGFYNYDEEFIKISKEIYVRMTIIDAHTRLIINDQLIRREEFTKETIKKYFKESFKGLKLNTIITDGYSAYPEIIEEIGAKHHSCTFHIMQRLMTPLQKHINKLNRSIKSLEEQIEKTTEKIEQLKNKMPLKKGRAKKTDKKRIKNQNQRKNLKLKNDKNKFKLKQIKNEVKEYIEYKEKISQIFKSKSIKTAMNRFYKLNEKFDEMPEIIQDFMRKLSKKLEITLNHTQNRKIPSTNNLAELIFRVTFPGKIKRIFRTYKGAKRQIRLNNLNWTKRNVLGEK